MVCTGVGGGGDARGLCCSVLLFPLMSVASSLVLLKRSWDTDNFFSFFLACGGLLGSGTDSGVVHENVGDYVGSWAGQCEGLCEVHQSRGGLLCS